MTSFIIVSHYDKIKKSMSREQQSPPKSPQEILDSLNGTGRTLISKINGAVNRGDLSPEAGEQNRDEIKRLLQEPLAKIRKELRGQQ